MSLLIPKYNVSFHHRINRETLPSGFRCRLPHLLSYAAAICLIALIVSCAGHNREPPLMIATAASMQRPMDSLMRGFTDRTGMACNKTVSSSGNHTAQITAGAPFDVFVSADMKYPDTLFLTGRTLGPPKTYGYGRTVLWIKNEDIEPTIASLASTNIRRIVVPNPRNAPYGRLSIQALEGSGHYDQIKDKLIYAQSVAQANHFMVSGTVDAGFTANSSVIGNTVFDKGRFVVLDAEDYPSIAQGIVAIRRPQGDTSTARAFIAYVLSDEGKRILHQFGYTTEP